MDAAHLDLALIGPAAAELNCAADQDRPRFGGDEQLAQIALLLCLGRAGMPLTPGRSVSLRIFKLEPLMVKPTQDWQGSTRSTLWPSRGIRASLAVVTMDNPMPAS
jgi:hypothetical protein